MYRATPCSLVWEAEADTHVGVFAGSERIMRLSSQASGTLGQTVTTRQISVTIPGAMALTISTGSP